MKKTIITIFILIAFWATAYSQYTFQPLQKSFENTAFFGQPMNIIPGYYGNLGTSFMGVIDDPFLNLALNPALLPDKPHYIYTAFQTTPTISTNYGPVIAYFNTVAPYYNNGDNQWHIAQPSFTTAYLGRPFNNSKVFIGLAYQGLYFNDDYYSVPDNTYLPETDFTALDATGVLPTDNADKMIQNGHFFTVWAGYEFNGASVGLKINRSLFNRTGRSQHAYGYGCCYLAALDYAPIIDPYFNDGTRSRSQNYSHWDVSVGLNKTISENFSAGLSLGLIVSEAGQGFNRNIGNLYYSPITITNLNFFNSQNSSVTQGWKQDGNTWYGSLYGSYKFNKNSTLTFSYRMSQFSNDLSIESLNTGKFLRKNSRPTYPDTATVTLVRTGHSLLTHEGGGRMKDTDHRLSLIMNMDFGKKFKTFFGIQFSYLKRGYDTSERVSVSKFWSSKSTYAPSGFVDSTQTQRDIIKDLKWNFDGYFRTFRFPVMLKIQVTHWLNFDMGASPVFIKHHYSAPVINDFQIRKIVVNGDIIIRRDFTTKFNNKFTDYDFRMPAFFGVSVQPNNLLSFRISASPVIFKDDHGFYQTSNWQGFINLLITP